MKEMDKMSEFDPTALARALDLFFSQVQKTPQFGFGDAGPHLDQLVSKGHLTHPETDTLRGILAKAHAHNRPPAATVVKDIDELLGHDPAHGPLALAILKTIRFTAETEASREEAGTPRENAISIPNVDWGAAADGAIEGAGWGSTIAGGLGGLVGEAVAGPGFAAAMAVGCGAVGGLYGGFWGGVIEGLAHGASNK
jgi:hypothetical protein